MAGEPDGLTRHTIDDHDGDAGHPAVVAYVAGYLAWLEGVAGEPDLAAVPEGLRAEARSAAEVTAALYGTGDPNG